MRHAAIVAVAALGLAAGLAGPAPAATSSIGVATAAAPEVTGTPPGASRRVIMVGTKLIYNERVQTSAEGQTQILFADQSTLTLGPNSDVTIDNYVYDPERGTGQMALSISKGVFRFVGGRISESAEATLRTPSATMGIRGSVLLGDSSPLRLILVQVRDFFIQNEHGRLEYSRNGRIIAVPSPGAAPVDIGPVTTHDIVALQGSLEGSRGNNGGALPVEADRRLANAAELEKKRDEPGARTRNPELRQYQDPTGAGGATPLPPPPPPQPLGAMSGRLVHAPGGEQSLAAAGIVDGRFRAETAGGGVDLPAGGGSFAFEGTGTVEGATVSGFGFTAPAGDFVAYRLFPAGAAALQGAGASYLMAGIPTPAGGDVAATGLVRAYDPIDLAGGAAPLPFLPGAFQDAFAGGSRSPFLVIERDGGTVGQVGPAGDSGGADSRSRTLYAVLDIEGEGAAQRSLFGGTAGALGRDGQGKLSLDQRFVATARGDAGEGPALISTPLGTMRDGSGNQFFGPDLDYMTIWQNGQGLAGAQAGTGHGTVDPLGAGGSFAGETYGHIGAFAQSGTSSSAALGRRASGTLYGYAAGTIDRADGEGGLLPAAILSPLGGGPAPDGVVITRSTVDNSVSATFRLRTDIPNGDDIAVIQAEYGGSGQRGGTYIDDGRFGANQSLEREGVVVLNPFVAQPTSAALQGFAATAGLAGGADALPGGVAPCTCAFLSWGWWSADVALTMPGGSVRHDRVHLGTWVAGDLPALAEVPTVGEATYQGHIVGTVVANGASYVAAGAFQDLYNFGTRTGAITITQFDGRDYTGSTAASADNRRDFAGGVASADGIVGALNGSFVRNGADPTGGVIGQATFQAGAGVAAGDYRASATFAAGKISAAPPAN